MTYIGKKPARAALTSSDLAADIVTAAKIADDAISEEHLDASIITGLTALGATPADTDELIISDAGTLKRMDYSHIKGGGITNAQQWRVNSTFQGDANPITANWEEVDTYGYNRIGDTMASSSGVFTFPSTGFWYITAQGSFQTEGGQSDNYRQIEIQTTTNNSTYNVAATGWNGGIDSTEYGGGFCSFIFDVTDTSNCKVRFSVDVNQANTYTLGSTEDTWTGGTFIRLGDT